MLNATSTSDNIIPLHRFRTDQSASALRLVEGYWSALRENGGLPKRSQVHPGGLTDALAHVFILERVAHGVARFRIAGSQVTQLMGMEVRGMPISTFFDTKDRQKLSDLLETCFRRPAIVETTLSARGLWRGDVPQGQMILLPMRCDQGGTNRILGAVDVPQRRAQGGLRLTLGVSSIRSVCGRTAASSNDTAQNDEAHQPRGAYPQLRLAYSSDRQ